MRWLRRQRQPFAGEGPDNSRPGSEPACVRGPMGEVLRHVEGEGGAASPGPINQQMWIRDAIAFADGPGACPDLRIHRTPEFPASLFCSGRDVLDRAWLGCVAGRSAYMHEGHVNRGRKPIEPF